MANINFYLKSIKPDKKGLKPILLQITFNYRRFRIHTGEKIKPSLWNDKKQRVHETKDFANEQENIRINKFLDDIEFKVKKLITHTKLNNIDLSEAYFKNNLFEKEKPENHSFFELFNEYIETSKSIRAERTIRGYTTIKNLLEKFEEYTKYSIELNNIDFSFFDKLKDYSFRHKKVSDNYFCKIVNVIKSFLNWAKDRGYYNNDIHKKFTAVEREKEVIYLRIDELMKLYEFDFKNEKLNKVRDIYCFGCFTGLRISDIKQLNREHIKDGVILKTIQKTKSIESIPINSFAQKILDKYTDLPIKPLPVISEQKLNKYIKDCCEIAEINEKVTTISFSGSKTIENTKPKYEYITSHTARKTFVTNSLILGMNTKTIKEITGHKKDSVFNKYLKISEDFKKIEMENTWNKLQKTLNNERN